MFIISKALTTSNLSIKIMPTSYCKTIIIYVKCLISSIFVSSYFRIFRKFWNSDGMKLFAGNVYARHSLPVSRAWKCVRVDHYFSTISYDRHVMLRVRMRLMRDCANRIPSDFPPLLSAAFFAHITTPLCFRRLSAVATSTADEYVTRYAEKTAQWNVTAFGFVATFGKIGTDRKLTIKNILQAVFTDNFNAIPTLECLWHSDECFVFKDVCTHFCACIYYRGRLFFYIRCHESGKTLIAMH